MKYTSLKKFYYQDQQVWADKYAERFNSPFTTKIDFYIKEYNYNEQHRAFYCQTDELPLLLNQILTDSFKMLKCLAHLPNVAILQFISSSLISEIKSSNAIEGVHSTRKEIREALTGEANSKYARLWGLVNKYKKVIENEDIKLQTPQDIRHLYDDFIYQEIKQNDPINLPDGILFRKNPVDIVTKTDRIIHNGAFPESSIIDMLDKALFILYDENIPSLIRIAIFHYLFAYIHPFYDGNGRMTRFITSYFLAKEIHPIVALHVSVLIKSNKNKYYKVFEDTNSNINRGDLTPFIIMSLELILASINKTISTLSKKLDTFKIYESLLEIIPQPDSTTMNIYHILLQAAIFSDIGATLEEIASTTNKSTKTVKSRLDEMPTYMLITNKNSRPYHYKLNLSYLNSLR